MCQSNHPGHPDRSARVAPPRSAASELQRRVVNEMIRVHERDGAPETRDPLIVTAVGILLALVCVLLLAIRWFPK